MNPRSPTAPPLPVRPRARSAERQRSASLCACGSSAGPVAGPAEPTVTGKPTAWPSSAASAWAAAPVRRTAPPGRCGRGAARPDRYGPARSGRSRPAAGGGGHLAVRDEHAVPPVQVDAQPACAGRQGARVAGAREQVAQQLTPYPVLRLGDRAAQQHEQRGDDAGALEQEPVGVREPRPAGQRDGAEELGAREDGADPGARQGNGPAPGPGGGHRRDRLRQRLGAGAGQFGAVRVMDQDPAVQDVGEGRRHVVGAAALQDEVGELVVRFLGAAHRLAVRPDGLRRGVEVDQRGPGLLQQPRPVDGDGGVVGQGREQRHLRGGELAGARSAAYSTPMTRAPRRSGTPRIARRPSFRTALSMVVVWWNRGRPGSPRWRTGGRSGRPVRPGPRPCRASAAGSPRPPTRR